MDNKVYVLVYHNENKTENVGGFSSELKANHTMQFMISMYHGHYVQSSQAGFVIQEHTIDEGNHG